ncbi:hypothetical protein GCM10010521_45950 [Streptomyces rameus]|uniref:Uncharacterized protein n=1 Tax=Streptomyces rameus TaxID=68261 RepID=A0ABP6NM23_9ACTN
MRNRLLRSVLVATFAAVATVGVLAGGSGGRGDDAGDSVWPLAPKGHVVADSVWPAVAAAKSTASVAGS